MTLVFPLISKYVHVHFTIQICFGILYTYSVDCVGEGGGGGSALAQVCTTHYCTFIQHIVYDANVMVY